MSSGALDDVLDELAADSVDDSVDDSLDDSVDDSVDAVDVSLEETAEELLEDSADDSADELLKDSLDDEALLALAAAWFLLDRLKPSAWTRVNKSRQRDNRAVGSALVCWLPIQSPSLLKLNTGCRSGRLLAGSMSLIRLSIICGTALALA